MKEAFDLWIREKAPPVQDDPAAERHLRERIADRLHARRQCRVTRGAGLAAAAVVLAVLGLVDIRPLGGDNWSLIPAGESPGGREQFKVPLTGEVGRYGKSTIPGVSTHEFWERVIEQRAAGAYELDATSFYEIGDEILWSMFYRHVVADQSASAAVPGGIDRPSTMSSETSFWLNYQLKEMFEGIETGRCPEEPARLIRINGRDFWFRVWVKDTERGPLRYGTAVIPADLK